MNRPDCFPDFADKMDKAGISRSAIQAFHSSYSKLLAGDSGLIPESEIQPVSELPRLDDINVTENRALLSQTVVIKLNGGLGTSMGLDGPKSLLEVKDGLTFLDFIARQILFLRRQFSQPLRFLLMNSFSTTESTLHFLAKYPELGEPKQLELMQGLVPKVDAATFRPVSWPANPQLEWCPPGHGDIYPSLVGSGWLNRLLDEGVRFAFVSNSDNLGASLDLRLLTYFADSGKSFMMEVTARTEADKKGGHLARRTLDRTSPSPPSRERAGVRGSVEDRGEGVHQVPGGKLLLRESVQCPESDTKNFQDITRHRFFNTNNLWIRLDSLKQLLDQNAGIVPLPLIKNAKTVDPRDKNSPAVFQLETAMGAAIESFENSAAINVPRSRFAPVKTTSDLLTLRSDACQITDDWRIVLAPELQGQPPAIDLDPDHYKVVDQFEQRFQTVPSLKNCQHLKVQGPVNFPQGIVLRGNVEVSNKTAHPQTLPPGVYENQTILLPLK